jgi:hypothetical protein
LAGFEQYHEPATELPQEVRTFARMVASLIEEADAIDWYQQRMSLEHNEEARKIMQVSQQEEMLHFAMDLEWCLRRMPKWKAACQGVLFQDGDIVGNKEKAEKSVDQTPHQFPQPDGS